jgi:serine phosphatase RsbU (regulator of sigma subunit)
VTARKSERSGVVAPLDLKTLLASVEAAPPVDAAEVVAAALTDSLEARDVSFLIADYSGRSLIRLSHVRRMSADDDGPSRERGQAVTLVDTSHGRALAQQDVQIVKDSAGFRVFAPVTSRGEAVGVLELGLDAEPDEQTLAVVSAGAHALAYIVIANRRFTDLFDWGQRSVPLSLEAELQHRLLPASYTCEGGQFTLAGWLEPAGDVGGDTFDFSVERDTLHLSITDAMGHTLNAAVLATVFVGALRNARRRGVSLAQQTQLANEALYGFGDDSDFVTGQVVRVDHASGLARVVNAGHPPPILIREGRAETVKLAPGLPFGVSLNYDYPVQALQLEAGDRLVFLTDGILERNAAKVNATEVLTQTRELHAREAVQALTQAVVDACGGELRDDATVLCVDWHGGSTGERDASSGADQ